ncbi:MAG: TerD family protein [Treponema sp.]|nr:TerD family protein [Treponema sp.]
MAISLSKGQKVSLTKDKPGLSEVCVGLGWDEVKKSKGFFASLLSTPQDIDCDASVYLLKNGKLASGDDMIFFNNKKHKSGAVYHHGDNLTGGGDGDDEQVTINLQKVPAEYDRIAIAVNIYKAGERKQHFGMVENAFIRVVDKSNNTEICRYNLTDNYSGSTGVIFGEVFRDGGEWKFNAVGEGIQASYINEVAAKFS